MIILLFSLLPLFVTGNTSEKNGEPLNISQVEGSQLVFDNNGSQHSNNLSIVSRSNFITLEEDCSHSCMDDCSDGWIQFEDKCYKWSKDQMTWEDAERSCRSEGGHLASVSNQATQNFLVEQERTGIWIGAYQSGW